MSAHLIYFQAAKIKKINKQKIMKSKYFTVEVKPVMATVNAGLNAAFADGDVLFDWTSFEIPRGSAKLIGVTFEARPKGDSGATPNIFALELLFAKDKRVNGTLTAPGTLGPLNAAPANSGVIADQCDTFIGHAPIVAGDFGVTDPPAVAFADVPNGMVFAGDPSSGSNVGVDKYYVGGIAGGAFDFRSLTKINNGDLDGPTLTVDGTDPRLIFAAGDTIAVTTVADATVQKAVGTIDSITDANTIVLTSTSSNEVANNDAVYNVSPIRLLLTFEK